jgi:hypothetical protein
MEKITIREILNTIDKTKMESCTDLQSLCDTEFDIYDPVCQQEGKERLKYCYYYSWVCTDTHVGIKVWYFDYIPVCISWKQYRKASECFAWIDKKYFEKVRSYILSLVDSEREYDVTIATDDMINETLQAFILTEHKQHEKFNAIIL